MGICLGWPIYWVSTIDIYEMSLEEEDYQGTRLLFQRSSSLRGQRKKQEEVEKQILTNQNSVASTNQN